MQEASGRQGIYSSATSIHCAEFNSSRLGLNFFDYNHKHGAAEMSQGVAQSEYVQTYTERQVKPDQMQQVKPDSLC